MKVITVVGARPQFIKAAAVSRAIAEYNDMNDLQIEEKILHTGQHYDEQMSAVFFEQLEIPKPKYNLGIVEKTHGAMTGRMLADIEAVLIDETPDALLVYGDTNSTLAGALAAAKLHIPVIHVEAGLRSFNMMMPEEINRILTDRVSQLLLCPTQTAVENLAAEGISAGVYNVGDVMFDVTLYYRDKAREQFPLTRWGLEENGYLLCTIHRAENTDEPGKLGAIFSALQSLSSQLKVVIPLHPRTRKLLNDYGYDHYLQDLYALEPVSYLEMISLESAAKIIVTDSGGMQKEAFFHGVSCVTIRDQTEWVETVSAGVNQLCSTDKEQIVVIINDLLLRQAQKQSKADNGMQPYGKGKAAQEIVRLLVEEI